MNEDMKQQKCDNCVAESHYNNIHVDCPFPKHCPYSC